MESTSYPTSPIGEWRKIYRDTPLLMLRDMVWRSLGFVAVALFGWYFFGRDLGFLIFLVVAIAIGVAAFFVFRPSITLICTPDDFTLVHRNVREVFYLQSHPWQDLIASRYEETVQRNYRRGRVTETRTRTFAIDLRDGYGVTFSESTDGFRDLIATVGEQTRHIPYLWVPSQGAVGRVVEQAGDYSLIPRQTAEVQRVTVT
jgi:hypothetical protein